MCWPRCSWSCTTGIGELWGKRAVLEGMPPWQGGGNMMADATFDKTVCQPLPNKFASGTGNIADAVGARGAPYWRSTTN